MPELAHLHLHSESSLLDGAARIKDVTAEAARLGMPALAITDHGSMYGVIDFYKACRKAGVKPVLGCEFYVAPRGRGDRTPHVDDDLYHLVLLAENREGYQNLLRLSSLSFTEGFYNPYKDIMQPGTSVSTRPRMATEEDSRILADEVVPLDTAFVPKNKDDLPYRSLLEL